MDRGGHTPRSVDSLQKLEKGKEMDSPLEPSQRNAAEQNLHLAQWELCGTYRRVIWEICIV